MSGNSREPGAISINKVPFINSCPNWALQRGVLAPYANRIRFLEESSLSGGPLLTSSSECLSPQQSPLSSANGVAIGVSPPGEWLSPAKGFPSFEGFPSPSEWHSHHGPSPFHSE